jgi:hypothetical protein
MLLQTGGVPGFKCLPWRRSSPNLLFADCLSRIVRLVDRLLEEFDLYLWPKGRAIPHHGSRKARLSEAIREVLN